MGLLHPSGHSDRLHQAKHTDEVLREALPHSEDLIGRLREPSVFV